MTPEAVAALVAILAAAAALARTFFVTDVKVRALTSTTEDNSVPAAHREIRELSKRIVQLEKVDAVNERLVKDIQGLERSIEHMGKRIDAMVFALQRKGVNVKSDPDPRDT